MTTELKYFEGSFTKSKSNLNDEEKSNGVDTRYDLYNQNMTQLRHNTQLDIYNPPMLTRRSGIICTIGPASREVNMLKQLMEAGMNVVRLNFSHGTHDYHRGTAKNAREAASLLKRDICIALDTKGPEIRTGNFKEKRDYLLKKDSKVRLTINEENRNNGTESEFFVDYQDLIKIKKDAIVYIDDGLVSLKVVSIGKDYVDTVVQNEGVVSNHKGVNLPGTEVFLPALSKKDKGDLKLGVEELNIDMIFASFVRTPKDVLTIREELVSIDKERGSRIQIISKIENHEGVQNFDEILKVTDGVMVARGDLGIEIDPEKVFLAQKMMIAKCNIAGKPVIVATQMLESMIKNPRPTRAEVSDVANAVLDGADCVMLSGETAKGNYPIQAVSIMARICLEAESARNTYVYFRNLRQTLSKPLPTQETVASTAVQACYEHHLAVLIVLTNKGDTARLVAKFRPPCPVIAVVGQKSAYTSRQLAITSGVTPITYDDSQGKKSSDERVQIGIKYAKERGWVKKDQAVCAVHADKLGRGFANLIRIVHVV